jgi:shikimate kinase
MFAALLGVVGGLRSEDRFLSGGAVALGIGAAVVQWSILICLRSPPHVFSFERLAIGCHALGVTESRPIHNLALIGFMGTGKSSVGRLVARVLHFDFVDTDHLIEVRTQKTISRIFEEEGERVFRDYETETIRELEPRRKVVIATGGGLPLREENMVSLKSHALVVCLWGSPESIWKRVRSHSHRPLLRDPDPMNRIRELLAAREPFYRAADVLVNTELRSLQEVAQHVVLQFHMARSDR